MEIDLTTPALLFSAILLIISLAISVYEIYISVKSLEIHLNDMHE